MSTTGTVSEGIDGEFRGLGWDRMAAGDRGDTIGETHESLVVCVYYFILIIFIYYCFFYLFILFNSNDMV